MWYETWPSFNLIATRWWIRTFLPPGFVLLTYPDKKFGEWWQYLGAFIAGATGQVAIAWKLLPWYRSYTAADKAS
jgi:hypothetical protein